MAIFLRFLIMLVIISSASFTRYMEKSREAKERMRQQAEQYEQELQNPVTAQQKTPMIIREFSCAARPEVYRVDLEDIRSDGDLDNPNVINIYEVDTMSSGVVGLVGIPVRVTYHDEQAQPKLTFYYDKDELRGIPERNLIILHEDEDGFYVQVGTETINENEGSISVDITQPGVYLVADRYQWYSAWGVDVSEYAYQVDPLTIRSDWERSCYTGSIMEIADREWAMANAPVFHVSTPEQLAGVVYYNNAVMDYAYNGGSLTVYLENDIDLEGYEWVPMGWLGPSDSRFNGLVDGQGHAIKNMNLVIDYDDHCAFIAYSTGVDVRNVTFENATVNGGRYSGIVGGEIYISKEWENVKVSGVLIEPKGEYGSIIGREAYLNFKNCSADVIMHRRNGEESRVEYFSHRQEVIANTPATEDFQLTLNDDGSVTRTEAEGEFRNLMWHLDVEGVMILQRNAENEMTLDAYGFFADYLAQGKKCKIWLDAYTGETYTRVSNVIEYKRK
ncbi:MAG: hypothetical protein IKS85_09205 [Lachnospiraceae bacterium]|nr:hypothetical protein [Lachnospiraceae bacterium]